MDSNWFINNQTTTRYLSLSLIQKYLREIIEGVHKINLTELFAEVVVSDFMNDIVTYGSEINFWYNLRVTKVFGVLP